MMPYIIHAGLLLAACLVFYKILLQKETFFRLNRLVLIACLVLSFGLPLVEVPQQWSFRESDALVIVKENFVFNTPLPSPTITESKQAHSPVAESINWIKIIFIVYWLGAIIFAVNFLIQIALLYYRAYTKPVIIDGKFRIVELSGDQAPCSFGNHIFINPEKYDWETYNQIIQHEKIHATEKHTLDLIVAELVIIFQWFNPFAWWYRKELEKNLEFLTDDHFLHNPQAEKTTYQLSLLKVSAPHFPLSLTTNYNQSLLKKRVTMMNAKKSNVHTTWKYLFLVPVLALSISLLNKPVAQSVAKKENKENRKEHHGMPAEGYWFATIKEDKVNMQFKSDEADKGSNNTTFKLSDFKNMPREGSGVFTVAREAGTIEFTGKFENNQGMGRYKFTADKEYGDAMRKEGIDLNEEGDQLVFFMIDVKKDYVSMLKRNGYTKFNKNDIIPMVALQIDENYIQSLKKAGFNNISMGDLVPMKAVGVTPDYAEEIRKAGYPNVTANQLITFKAQGIDAKYIADVRQSSSRNSNRSSRSNQDDSDNSNKENKNDNDHESGGTSIDNITAFKALHIDNEYISSLKALGYDNLDGGQLISMKGVDIDADYIRGWQNAGYKDISAGDLVAMKAQNITPDYMKSFSGVGMPNLSVQKAIPFKALGVTADYIKSFKTAGYDLSSDDVISMKGQHITPAVVKEYNELGFGKVPLQEVIAAKATNTTPQFIKSMKEKGHNMKSLQKYITLKTITDD